MSHRDGMMDSRWYVRAPVGIDEEAQHAEGLLHELAKELQRVPLCESTKRLHLRALSLKREVCRWSVLQCGASERAAVIAEIVELQRAVHRVRELPTGRQLAYEAARG